MSKHSIGGSVEHITNFISMPPSRCVAHGRLEVVQVKELGCSEISKNAYSKRLPPALLYVFLFS